MIALLVGWSFVAIAAAITFFLTRGRSTRSRGFSTILVALVAFIWMSQTVPGIATALPRRWQRDSVDRMLRIAEAMNKPQALAKQPGTIAELAKLTNSSLEPQDAWGYPFFFRAEPFRYVVISYGQCGEADRADPWAYSRGEATMFTNDVVLMNGAFVQLPVGIRVE